MLAPKSKVRVNPILLNLIHEGGPWNIELARGQRLVAGRAFQNLFYYMLFIFGHIFGQVIDLGIGAGKFTHAILDRVGHHLLADFLATGHDDHVFQNILQLPQIALPAILQ